RGAGLQSARAIYLCALPKLTWLMDVGSGSGTLLSGAVRKVKMRTEVFRRRRHFGRSPDIAQPQRIAANGQWSRRHVDTRRRTCALAVIRLLSDGVLHRRYRSRGLLEKEKLAKGGSP